MYSIYEKLLKEKGVKTADVAKATGIHPSSFSDWKKGKSSPKPLNLKKIADYFCVPVDVFYGEKSYSQSNQVTEYKIQVTEEEIQSIVNKVIEKKKEQYYIDPEVAELAQVLKNEPEMKVLFDAVRKVKHEDINKVAAMIKLMSGSND